MGEIVYTAKITHVPTMILSEQEGPFKDCRKPAIDSEIEIGRRIRACGADTILIFDTHWLTNIGFHLSANQRHQGVYTSHEIPHLLQDIDYDFEGNPELADLIAAATEARGLKAHAHKVPTLRLEYGTLLPMRYMNPEADLKVVPVASPLFASIDENRRFGEAAAEAIAQSDAKVAVFASGSLSHRLWDNDKFGPDSWFRISSAFNKQVDLRVLDLWAEGRWPEFLEMLPDYARKCDGEGWMSDTAMLFGLLGWDSYQGTAEMLCPYFEATGSGQCNVEFSVP